MPDAVPPFAIYLIGALIVPLLRGRVRQGFALLVPVVAFVNYFLIPEGTHWTLPFLDFELVLGRADEWSRIFLNIFTILSFAGILYVVRDNEVLDLSGGLLYAGSAMGVIMAGDLISMFIFWEMLTLAAVFCLLARRTNAAGKAAYRYLLVHIFGGVVLLAGLAIHLASGGSIAFDKIELAGPGPILMFIGFGINCAWPLVGAWLPDTYPEASVGGVVFMATYTTKTAVYVLARTFPGEPSLVIIGLVMATLPLFYAAIANDLRRVLSYCLVNQVGFMVIAIGLGTDLALNGAAAHAYCHILYKALLFMVVGSVIYRTGLSRATDLGGLIRSMPLTCLFGVLGALAMSSPWFCGFVSKSIIMGAAAKEGRGLVWMVLLCASAGVFLLAGIKVVYFAFFSRDSGIRCEEAPPNQLAAMALIAGIAFCIGAFPDWFFYDLLPISGADYQPYTFGHVTDQFALLLFCGLAFVLMLKSGLYPAEIRATNLDAAWFYRRGGKVIDRVMDWALNGINAQTHRWTHGRALPAITEFFSHGPSYLASSAMTPIWKLQGHDADEIAKRKQSVYLRCERGVFPIGITACLAVFLLALLFVVSYVSHKSST